MAGKIRVEITKNTITLGLEDTALNRLCGKPVRELFVVIWVEENVQPDNSEPILLVVKLILWIKIKFLHSVLGIISLLSPKSNPFSSRESKSNFDGCDCVWGAFVTFST
jgi:hypothetical protein